MNTANKITTVRVLMIPVFIVLMCIGGNGFKIAALVVFIIASITDWVDGYIARHYNQVTDFGKFMDPLADKLLVTSALLFFVQWGQMPAWTVMIIIAREFAISGLRMVAASSGIVIAAAWSGKIKTVVSIVAICIMLSPLHNWYIIAPSFTIDAMCSTLMLVTTVWSGIEYFVKNIGVLNTKK
jgi:CDP-diacylglycerol--glycerol-3-phosphate 3-phosphatidyltransferase